MTLKLLSTKIKISIFNIFNSYPHKKSWIFRFGTPIHKNQNFNFQDLELLSTKIWLFKFGSPNHKNQILNSKDLELQSTIIKIWISKKINLNLKTVNLNDGQLEFTLENSKKKSILGFRTPQNLNLLFMTLKLLSTKIKISIFNIFNSYPHKKSWIFRFGTPIHKNQNFNFQDLELLSTKKWLFKFGRFNHKNLNF